MIDPIWGLISDSMDEGSMARAGLYFLPDQPLHVTRRGNSRDAIFFDETD